MTTCISFIFTVKITVSLTRRIDFLDNPIQVVIDNFEFDVGDRFTYEYNFLSTRFMILVLKPLMKTPR
ncbi:hypothetical protein HmCmsJML055_01253 [Escherichia coli]|nr:hypothetical protein HmCmsJML021_04571 [Escherichia coli]GCV48964.1 hypothetical protein HmCmsJML055_01253 [Escherichia coli]GCV49096.1 hypothetical protein HmCmsJML029_04466 [Escherichia coli]GCW25737.1 hypothetical protein HmCmsJML097_00070 [Escherichia coli]GCY76768.1 hypothetical protein HmCmsJML071_01433 [Escherichia coli]